MAYTPATSLPTLYFPQWQTLANPNPSLSAPLLPSDTTAYFTSPLRDHAGDIITGGFLMGIKNADSYVMTCYIAPNAVSVDGLSATVVQGIRLEGTDYTTSDPTLIPAEGFSAGDAIFANISGVIQALTIGAIRGTIATNGLGFIVGDGTASNATISHKDNASTKGFLRKNPSTAKVQYSNDGSAWVNIDDVTGSDLLKISNADTSAGYLENKLLAGGGISVTKGNTGANETLTIALGQGTVVTPSTYTSAFLTGGNSAEATFSNWLAVISGSFTITINGVVRVVSGIDMTGVTSMADVAAKIQTAIRALTSATETVVWSTNHFIINAGNLTSSSAITVTSTGGGGTDISGAGAANWMDCDTGHGVVTNAVLNQVADAGKVPVLNSLGLLDNALIDYTRPIKATFTTGEAIDGSTTPQAVYIKASDGYIYKTVASGTESTFKFIGFVTTNALISTSINVIISGTVSGFTALTVDTSLNLTDAAGGISTTPGTLCYKVARAITTTSIIIEKGSKVYAYAGNFSLTSTGNTDTVVTCGFQPSKIRLIFLLTGSQDSNTPKYTLGEATYSGTTLQSSIFQIMNNTAVTVSAATFGSILQTPVAGTGGAGNNFVITLSILSVSTTGFTMRLASVKTGTGSGTASVTWEAIE
ncbi:MAG: DUF3383 family protein [Lentisphaerota bacterium]